MTDHDELAGRVQWWMDALGIGEWRFAVAAGAGDEQLGDTSAARIHRTEFYDHGTMMLRGGRTPKGVFALDAIAPDDDESIVHELLHVIFDDWTKATDDALKFLPERAQAIMRDRLLAREEQAVERLSRIIVGLARYQDEPIVAQPPRLFGATAEPGLLDFFREGEPEPDGPLDEPDRDEPAKRV